MKKWMVFVLGVIVGVCIYGFVDLIKLTSESKGSVETEVEVQNDDGVTMFEEPGDIIDEGSVKVFQVLAKDAALVNGGKSKYSDLYTGIVYLLLNKEGKYYYDEQIVKVPKGCVLRQVGIYHYKTQNDIMKTVPIIMIMDN